MALRSVYFSAAELACKCKSPACDAADMDPRFLLMADQIRHKWGKPLIITSARRCKQHNMAVGGAVKSMHVYGRALDILVSPDDHFKFLDLVRREGITGVGRAATWFHIDNRDGKFTTWMY